MAKIPNVSVKRHPKYGTYYLHFTIPDTPPRRRRISAGRDKSLAYRKAFKFTDWLMEGKDPEREMEKDRRSEQARQITLREFFPAFMERHGSNRSVNMQDSYHSSFKNIGRCKELADIPIGDINRGIMIDYMKARMKQDGVTAATVNREKQFVSVILSVAVEGDIIERSPLTGLKNFKEAPKRDVDISPQQAGALLEELSPSIADIVEFAIYTGFRIENVLSLRIESARLHDLANTGEVDLVIKGGRLETFPLGPHAIEVFKRVSGGRKSGYAFISPRTNSRRSDISWTFNKAVRKLGLTARDGSKLRIHDLRHIFGTWLNDVKVRREDIRELLGHYDLRTTDRYVTSNRVAVGLEVLAKMPRIRQG